jgi:hypothetical protein
MGASATLTFTGRMIGLVATRSPAHGVVRIYVDGALVASVDCQELTTRHRSVVWQRSYATSATRTIKVAVVGTSGRPRVDLDAFIVVR